MIRIERGAEVSPGVFSYRVASLGIQGKSRQSLLDACPQVKRIPGPTGRRAGLFPRRKVRA
jgi:hypothetical protein